MANVVKSKCFWFMQYLGLAAILASLLIVVFSWPERGYAPRLRITRASRRLNGQNLTPAAFSPDGDVLADFATPHGSISPGQATPAPFDFSPR